METNLFQSYIGRETSEKRVYVTKVVCSKDINGLDVGGRYHKVFLLNASLDTNVNNDNVQIFNC